MHCSSLKRAATTDRAPAPLVAIAQAAGLSINWDDFADLSQIVPLLARVYPNGGADVNHFHAAGGAGFLIGV